MQQPSSRVPTPTLLIPLLCAVLPLTACESPTDPDETVTFEDLVELTASPDPTSASGPTGRFYTVVVNDVTETREYDWKTTFSVHVKLLTTEITSDDDLVLPVDISGVTVNLQQATSGIVVPPTGGDTEHYTYTPRASANRISDVGGTVTIEFDVWYDLPNVEKEALVTVNLTLVDDDGFSFSGSVKLRVQG